VLTVADVSLMAPKGLSGTLSLNMLNLVKASMASENETLSFKASIERDRAGATETFFLVPQVIRRDIIDLTNLTVMPGFAGGNYQVTSDGWFELGNPSAGYIRPIWDGVNLTY
jgi:hypothetical protein